MADDPDRFAFEKYPRQQLNFDVTRRQFLPALVREFLVSCDRDNGRPTYKLSDLGVWPDEKLTGFLPQVVRGCRISVKDGFVWGQPSGAKKPIQLFPLDSPARVAFNGMNGQNTIQEISDELQQETTWDPGQSFAYVRGLFLWLVLTRVCQPVNCDAVQLPPG